MQKPKEYIKKDGNLPTTKKIFEESGLFIIKELIMADIEEQEKKGVECFKHDFGDWYIIEPTDSTCYWDLEATASTDPQRTYLIEIKSYLNKEHPRTLTKYKNYQIDYWKVKHLVDAAKEQNRIPVLYCYFEDYSIVWDLSEIDFESRKHMVKTNKLNYQYGKIKEETLQTYLYKDEAKWCNKHGNNCNS